MHLNFSLNIAACAVHASRQVTMKVWRASMIICKTKGHFNQPKNQAENYQALCLNPNPFQLRWEVFKVAILRWNLGSHLVETALRDLVYTSVFWSKRWKEENLRLRNLILLIVSDPVNGVPGSTSQRYFSFYTFMIHLWVNLVCEQRSRRSGDRSIDERQKMKAWKIDKIEGYEEEHIGNSRGRRCNGGRQSSV